MMPLQVEPRISIYQPEQPGLIFPEIPDFDTIEAEHWLHFQILYSHLKATQPDMFDQRAKRSHKACLGNVVS